MKCDIFTDQTGRKWSRVILYHDDVINIAQSELITPNEMLVFLLNDAQIGYWQTSKYSDVTRSSNNTLEYMNNWSHINPVDEWKPLVSYLYKIRLGHDTTKKRCDCPIDVLMRDGCQCGGI